MTSIPRDPEEAAGSPTQEAHRVALAGNTAPILRHALDFLIAGAAMVFLSPLFLAIGLAIKLDDGGSVFYSQPRVGRDFHEFRMLKFRSMAPGADRGALLTSPDDSRVTRVGRFLRKHKLDELPQLFNVLRGDMQLVGPRPEIPRYVEQFRSKYAVLLRDRPGITDPASIAFRNEEALFQPAGMEHQYLAEILPAKLQLSVDYARRRTLRSDLEILVRTVLGSSNTEAICP